jgi:DNA mismatch repair protein MutS2
MRDPPSKTHVETRAHDDTVPRPRDVTSSAVEEPRVNGDDALPDLLHPLPIARIDAGHTKVAMTFAFASGVSGGLFADALDAAKVAPSTWDPSAFAGDLFLTDLVARCFKIRVAGNDAMASTHHLAKVLASPPTDPAVILHRRAICAELVEVPERRAELERVYLALVRFRALLEGATIGRKYDANRRQVEILARAKDALDAMADGFTGARSGLARLRAFGQRVRASEPYASLADLLRYDEHLATVSLDVRLGADGRIQGLAIRSVRENADNPFVASPLRRWLGKVELFVRGFRFGEGEVMARLLDAVFEGIADDLVPLVQLLGDVEVYLGALGFYDMARAAGLEASLPGLVPDGGARALVGLFNPLLLAHGVAPVPCDVRADKSSTTTLVTGPNSGGKTRLLQSLGIAQLLGQSGFFVPARAGGIALVPGLVMSLIQETKADQAEGRLGMELLRIRALFEHLPPGAMVILDELCSGTNPSEGEEIFELVVNMLTRLSPQAFITTHFLSFAARLEREQKIGDLRFLQVEIGRDDQPTYQFVPGVARTSLASHAAARLGVTGEQLLALVEQSLGRAAPRERKPRS